jgi:hypothetical protein
MSLYLLWTSKETEEVVLNLKDIAFHLLTQKKNISDNQVPSHTQCYRSESSVGLMRRTSLRLIEELQRGILSMLRR